MNKFKVGDRVETTYAHIGTRVGARGVIKVIGDSLCSIVLDGEDRERLYMVFDIEPVNALDRLAEVL